MNRSVSQEFSKVTLICHLPSSQKAQKVCSLIHWPEHHFGLLDLTRHGTGHGV